MFSAVALLHSCELTSYRGFILQMNESKLRKGTKYVALKDEDVHTVTGALKQFFRELKTDLIPIEIVKRLPDDLGE